MEREPYKKNYQQKDFYPNQPHQNNSNHETPYKEKNFFHN